MMIAEALISDYVKVIPPQLLKKILRIAKPTERKRLLFLFNLSLRP